VLFNVEWHGRYFSYQIQGGSVITFRWHLSQDRRR
jgi:hypothetical protein